MTEWFILTALTSGFVMLVGVAAFVSDMMEKPHDPEH